MLTTLVLGANAYSSSGVAPAGFAGVTRSWGDARLFGLRVTLDDTDYGSLEFSALGCGPALPFPPGLPVQLFQSADDGSGPAIQFAGDLGRPQVSPAEEGPLWGYSATDLKHRGDRVALLGPDGGSPASFNLAPTDPLYLFTTAGLTVGGIVAAVLQAPANASGLAGLGVGNYAGSGPYALPPATLADLAALDLVPPSTQLQGEAILSTLQALVQEYHPQYTLYVQADGTIRVASVFGRARHAFTIPSASTAGDPVDRLQYSGPDLTGCYTAVQISGIDVAGAVLSTRDGTLVPAWTPAQQAAWTSASFTSPSNADDANNANDTGTIVSYSATSVVLKSDYRRVKWDANFWNSNGGTMALVSQLNDGGSSIGSSFNVQVTSCTAMAPGGTATVTWDPSQAVTGSGFSRYRLYATNTPASLVGRKFFVATGSGTSVAKGTATWIGSHMYPTFPFGFAWANQGKGASSVQTINFPAAQVYWSQGGQYPFNSLGCPVDLDPLDGSVILSQPAVFLSAAMAAQSAGLASGYPTSFAQGLPYDVEVAIPYNRGDLSARAPASGFSGTAYARYGMQLVKPMPMRSFVWKGDAPMLARLAAQHLEVYQDAVFSGSIRLHYDAWTPTFDPLASFPYALAIATPGAASPLDGVDLPVRAVTFEWPNSGADVRLVTFDFNNKRRPFEGDSLYVHPSTAPSGWGTQPGEAFAVPGIAALPGAGEFVDHQEDARTEGFATTEGIAASYKAAGKDNPDRPAFSDADIAQGRKDTRRRRAEERVAARKAEGGEADERSRARTAASKTKAGDRVGPPRRLAGDPPREGAERFERQDLANGDFGGDVPPSEQLGGGE